MRNPFRNWSQFDADLHNARVAAHSPGAFKQDIIPGVPGYMPRFEAAEPGTENSVLRPACVQVCAKHRWLALRGRTDTVTGRTPGETDMVVACHGGIVVFAELKTRTGKMSTEQLGMETWLKRLGHYHIVARSAGEFEEKVLEIIAKHGKANAKT